MSDKTKPPAGGEGPEPLCDHCEDTIEGGCHVCRSAPRDTGEVDWHAIADNRLKAMNMMRAEIDRLHARPAPAAPATGVDPFREWVARTQDPAPATGEEAIRTAVLDACAKFWTPEECEYHAEKIIRAYRARARGAKDERNIK